MIIHQDFVLMISFAWGVGGASRRPCVPSVASEETKPIQRLILYDSNATSEQQNEIRDNCLFKVSRKARIEAFAGLPSTYLTVEDLTKKRHLASEKSSL